jgi:DNA repair proteins
LVCCYYLEWLCQGLLLVSLRAVCDFLVVWLCDCDYEVFCCLFLDIWYWLICFEELFCGIVDGVSVHLCEVVK